MIEEKIRQLYQIVDELEAAYPEKAPARSQQREAAAVLLPPAAGLRSPAKRDALPGQTVNKSHSDLTCIRLPKLDVDSHYRFAYTLFIIEKG